jgi:hypothetical protein
MDAQSCELWYASFFFVRVCAITRKESALNCEHMHYAPLASVYDPHSEHTASLFRFFHDLGYEPSTFASVRDAVRSVDLGVHVGSFTATLKQDESMLVKIAPKSQ